MPDGDDLKILFPDETIVVGGSELKIAPFTFGQWPQALKLGLPLVKAFNQSKLISFAKEGDAVTYRIADDWMNRIEQLLLEGGEPLMQFIAFAIGKKREWLDTIQADEGVALTKKVFGINVDFFNRKIKPMLPGLTEKADGEQQSQDSLKPGTVESTSTVTP